MRTPYSVVGFFWSMGFATAQAMTIQFPIVLNRASLPPVSNFTTVKDIAVGDLNGDLIPDIVVCGGENRVLLQSVSGYGSTSFDGHGSFSDVTPVQPPLPGVQHWGLGGEAVEVGDIDNDGDRDVVLCLNNLGFMAVPMLNDGLGLLTAGAPFNGPAGGPTGWPLVFDLRLADVDVGAGEAMVRRRREGQLPFVALLLVRGVVRDVRQVGGRDGVGLELPTSDEEPQLVPDDPAAHGLFIDTADLVLGFRRELVLAVPALIGEGVADAAVELVAARFRHRIDDAAREAPVLGRDARGRGRRLVDGVFDEERGRRATEVVVHVQAVDRGASGRVDLCDGNAGLVRGR